MINFRRINVKNSSSFGSSKHEESAMSASASSFDKPLSKDCDYRTEAEPQRQQIKDDSNRTQKSCLKSKSNVDSSPKKSVNFVRTARVRRVRPRNHFSQKEQEFMWYSEDDYVAIKRGAMETVKKMLKAEKIGGIVDDENFTGRGLECRMKKNAMQRKEFKAFARDLVLTEQNEQKEQGFVCSNSIRKVYLKASSIASTKAQMSGRKDADAVNDISLSEIMLTIIIEQNNEF